MPINTDSSLLIANSKKGLSQFILDLCGFSLDNAGYNSKGYAFHLHIAFRRQAILQAEKWEDMCAGVTENPLYWQDEASFSLLQEVQEFAQSIVNEVQQAEADPWSVKLIKTGYLSTLDKARKNSEKAIMLLAAPADAENLTASLVVSDDEETSQYLHALRLHITYLDSLLSLPFVLENFCLHLAENRGVNYEPRKNAQMLASLLDTINLAIDQKTLIAAIKIALQITMPSLPIDGDLLETIEKELLPFIGQIIVNTQNLQKAKETIFSQDDSTATARKTLLETVGVEFDSLQEVVQNTLLEPVQQCAELAAGMQGLTCAANRVIQSDNAIDRVAHIGVMFGHFDKLANIPNKISPALLPDWLRETNSYYQLLRTKLFEVHGMAEGAYNGLGVFYNQVVSYIPESIQRYFTTPEPLVRVWETIGANDKNYDVKTAMAYLDFYELATFSGIDEPIKERFYNAYMMDVLKLSSSDNAVIYDYGVYKKLERVLLWNTDLNRPLSTRMIKLASREGVLSDEPSMKDSPIFPNDFRKFNVLLMVHHLKNIEAQFNDHLTKELSVESILEELIEALKKEQDNKTIKAFKEKFLKPAIVRMLTAYMNKKFIPLLEQVIDNPDTKLIDMAHANHLPRIYSTLRADVNLSLYDYDELRRAFGGCEQFKLNEFTPLRRLAKRLAPKASPKVIACQTPHQVMLAEIKAKLSYVETAFTAILAGLDKQVQTSEDLQRLSVPGTRLYQLCQNKRDYIAALKTRINALIQDIHLHPDSLALEITRLLNGNKLQEAKDALKNTSKLKMATQLIRFAWHVFPTDDTKPDDNFLNNLLIYCLKDTDFGNVYDAGQIFSRELENNPLPELMPLLNDPLAIANIMPKQEEIMDSVVEQLLGLGLKGQSLLSWGTNFVTTTAQNLIGGINQETLISLFPYPFIGVIAWQMIQSEEMQAMLAPLLVSLLEEYGAIAADKAMELAEAAKNRIYPLLGIAIQKSVEKSAFNYAVGDKRGVNRADRDAFAMYYLQYQAIKQEKPDVDVRDCVKFLFKILLDTEDAVTRKTMISGIAEEFIALDNELHAEEAPDNQLTFLINTLDFKDPENHNIIRFTLINRLLLMILDASKTIESEERAINALSQILAKNNDAKHLPEQVDIEIDDHSFVAINSTSSMMTILKPAKERIANLQLGRLQKSLKKTKKQIDSAVDSRLEMLEANDKPDNQPFLGKMAGAVNYGNAKNNTPRKIVVITSFLVEAITFISFWAAIIFPAIWGGGLLQSLFVVLGIAGVAGTSASIVGAVVFGVLALARLTFKLGMELWTRRHELSAIVTNPDYSVVKKIGLTLLFGLKCISLALIKTVLTDYLLNKITYLLAFGPIKRLRNLFRFHPSPDTVEAERAVLADVADKLADLKAQIDGQIAEPALALSDSIDDIYLKLKDAMNTAIERLRAISSNDVRNTKEYRNTLASYEAAFANITQLYNAIPVIKGLELGMESNLEAKPAQEEGELADVVPAPEIVRPHIAIDMGAYYERTHPHVSADERLLPSFTVTLVSGFFQALAYAGRIFGWGNEAVAIQGKKVEDVGSSSSLDGSFVMIGASQVDVDRLLASICIIEDTPHITVEKNDDPSTGKNGFFQQGVPPSSVNQEPVAELVM